MAKIYFYRHQAGGVLHDYPFADVPTAEQVGALDVIAAARFGVKHEKTGKPYWSRVVARELITPSVTIEVPVSGPEKDNVVKLSGPTATATVTVTSPK